MCTDGGASYPPPSPPKADKSLTSINPTKDNCYWHCLLLKTGNTEKERDDARSPFCHETGIPSLGKSPWKKEFLFILPSAPQPSSNSKASGEALSTSIPGMGDSPGTRGPRAKRSTTLIKEGPLLISTLKRMGALPEGDTLRPLETPSALHSPQPKRPAPCKRSV